MTAHADRDDLTQEVAALEQRVTEMRAALDDEEDALAHAEAELARLRRALAAPPERPPVRVSPMRRRLRVVAVAYVLSLSIGFVVSIAVATPRAIVPFVLLGLLVGWAWPPSGPRPPRVRVDPAVVAKRRRKRARRALGTKRRARQAQERAWELDRQQRRASRSGS